MKKLKVPVGTSDFTEIRRENCYYIDKTNRRVTFEYSLINGVNDGESQARQLAAVLHGMLCHVNLIPVNYVKERGYKRSTAVREFRDTLEKCGINATVRRELGSDISASCGQLRRSHLDG